MPSGITAPIYEGEGISFEQYAWRVARMFGALVHMRDDMMGAAIRRREPSDFERNCIESDAQRLAELERLTPAEVVARYEAEYADRVRYYNERVAEVAQRVERINALLAKAEAWEPPTPDHEGFKKEMIRLLRQDLDFDGRVYTSRPEREDPHAWHAQQVEHARHSLARSMERLVEEQARCDHANGWVDALAAVVPIPEDLGDG